MKTITYDESMWQLVPKTPSDEMVKEGTKYMCFHDAEQTLEDTKMIYRDMLSSAPQPVAQEEQKPVAWHERQMSSTLHWGEWYPSDSALTKGRATAFTSNQSGVPYEFQPLYTSPPSSVQAYNEGLEAAHVAIGAISSPYESIQETHIYDMALVEALRAIRALKKAQEQSTIKDIYAISMLVAEAAYKIGIGRDKAVASDVLREIVESVIGKTQEQQVAQTGEEKGGE